MAYTSYHYVNGEHLLMYNCKKELIGTADCCEYLNEREMWNMIVF